MPPLRKAEKGKSRGCFPKQDASSCSPYIKLTCSNEQYPVGCSMHCVTGYPTMYRYFDIPQTPPQNITCCCHCKYCCRQLQPKQKCCKAIQTDAMDTNEQATQCPEDPVQVVEEKVTVVKKSVTRIMSFIGPTTNTDVPEESQSAKEKTTTNLIKTYSENGVALDDQKEEMEEATVNTDTNSNKDQNQDKPSTETDVKYTHEQPTPFSEDSVQLKDGKKHVLKTKSVTRIYSDGKVSTDMNNLSSESTTSKIVPEQTQSPEEFERPIHIEKRRADDLDLINTQKGDMEETSASNQDKDTSEQTEIPEHEMNVGTTQPIKKFYPDDNVSTEMDMSSKTDSEDLNSERKTSGMSDATPREFKISQVAEKPSVNPIDLPPDDNAVAQIDTPTIYTVDLSSGSRMNLPENSSEQKQATTTDSYLLDNTSNVTSDREHGYEDYAKDTESSESFKQNDSIENIEQLHKPHPSKTREINGEDHLTTDMVHKDESADVSNDEGENKSIEESGEEEEHREVQREGCSCCRMLPRILPYNPCPFYCNQCLCRQRKMYGCIPWQAYPVGTEANTPRWFPNCPPQRRQ